MKCFSKVNTLLLTWEQVNMKEPDSGEVF